MEWILCCIRIWLWTLVCIYLHVYYSFFLGSFLFFQIQSPIRFDEYLFGVKTSRLGFWYVYSIFFLLFQILHFFCLPWFVVVVSDLVDGWLIFYVKFLWILLIQSNITFMVEKYIYITYKKGKIAWVLMFLKWK